MKNLTPEFQIDVTYSARFQTQVGATKSQIQMHSKQLSFIEVLWVGMPYHQKEKCTSSEV